MFAIRAPAAAAALFIALAPAGAAADTRCGEADVVLRGLSNQYGEMPAFSGALSAGNPVTVTVAPSGTWTVMVAVGNQLCLVAGGKQWQALAPSQVKPQAEMLPDAPALLRNDLLLIRETP